MIGRRRCIPLGTCWDDEWEEGSRKGRGVDGWREVDFDTWMDACVRVAWLRERACWLWLLLYGAMVLWCYGAC